MFIEEQAKTSFILQVRCVVIGSFITPQVTGGGEENQAVPASPLTATQTMRLWELSPQATPPWDTISDSVWVPVDCCRPHQLAAGFAFLFAVPQGSESPWLSAEPWLAPSSRPGLKCLRPHLPPPGSPLSIFFYSSSDCGSKIKISQALSLAMAEATIPSERKMGQSRELEQVRHLCCFRN